MSTNENAGALMKFIRHRILVGVALCIAIALGLVATRLAIEQGEPNDEDELIIERSALFSIMKFLGATNAGRPVLYFLPSRVYKTDSLHKTLGEFYVLPEERLVNAPGFGPGDIKDLQAFATTLTIKTNAVSRLQNKRLDEAARRALRRFESSGVVPDDLAEILIRNLNRIVRGGCIYEDAVFRSVKLRPMVRAIAEQVPGNRDVGFNRLLLEDAFPQELTRRPTSMHQVPRDRVSGEEGIALRVDKVDPKWNGFEVTVALESGAITYYSVRVVRGVTWEARGIEVTGICDP